MGLISRDSFQRGWAPDADAVDSPPDCLLRMDNLVLDERNILSKRPGSVKVSASPLADTDIHSLFTILLRNSRYRMAGAGNHLYANGANLGIEFDGTGDILMGAYQGQVFSARGSVRKKYDGTTVRNWGIEMTGGAPTAGPASGTSATGGDVASPSDADVIISGDILENPALVWEFDDGTGPSYGEGRYSVVDTASSDAFTNKVLEYQAANPTEPVPESVYEGLFAFMTAAGFPNERPTHAGGIPSDDKIVNSATTEVWDVISSSDDPNIRNWVIAFSGYWVDGAPSSTPGTGGSTEPDPDGAAIMMMGRVIESHHSLQARATVSKTFNTLLDLSGFGDGELMQMDVFMADTAGVDMVQVAFVAERNGVLDSSPVFVTRWYSSGILVDSPPADAPGQNAWDPGQFDTWVSLSVLKGDIFSFFTHSDVDDWSRIKKVQVTIRDTQVLNGSDYTPPEVRIQMLRMGGTSGSTENPVKTDYRYVYARLSDCYTALSAPSEPSASFVTFNQGNGIAVPGDPNRDTQVNQVWLFRWIESVGEYYRVAVYDDPDDPTAFVGTGQLLFTDTMPDDEAVEINIKIEFNVTPPVDITGIEGPYYDRFFVIDAESIYPSRRLNPDSFSPAQVIRISCADDRLLWIKKSLGGMFIGTTRDIYRLDGTGAELPDGTMDFTLTPLNIDYPPASEAVAQEGNFLVYLSGIGWRVVAGAGSKGITGLTSMLWRSRSRHGVSAVNKSGRHRAAISNGELIAITPEGGSNSSSDVVYRYIFDHDRWYRHPYPTTGGMRSIVREPDGGVIFGDLAGFVRQLDSGTSDDGTPIPVTIYTPRDTTGNSYAPKTAANLSVVADTAGDPMAIAIHMDEAEVSAATLTASPTKMEFSPFDLTALPEIWNQIQLRITGSFLHFRLSRWSLTYNTLPFGVRAWDSGPMDIGSQELVRLRGIRIKGRLGAAVTARVYFDGVAFDPVTIDPGSEVNKITTFMAWTGRAQFGRTARIVMVSTETFYPYWAECVVATSGSLDKQDKPLLRFPSGLGGEAVG